MSLRRGKSGIPALHAVGDVVVLIAVDAAVWTVAEEDAMAADEAAVEWVVHKGKETGPALTRIVAITTLHGGQSATDVTPLVLKAWVMTVPVALEVSVVDVEVAVGSTEAVDVEDSVIVEVAAEEDLATGAAVVDSVTVDVAEEEEDLEVQVAQDQTEEAVETDGTGETSPIKETAAFPRIGHKRKKKQTVVKKTTDHDKRC